METVRIEEAEIEHVIDIEPEAPKEMTVVEPESAPPALPSDSTAIMQIIDRAARDPNVDMDKMERLLAMQERIFERQAKIDFDTAMAAAQKEMEPVARDAKGDKNTYARLEAIAKAITPIRAKHGFAASFGTADCPKENHYRITCELSHTGGYSKRYHVDIPIDLNSLQGKRNKTDIHAFGSTMTYGRRYLTLLIFDIATEDDDGNAAGSGEPISNDQMKTVLDRVTEVGADIEKFCRYLKVDAISQLPASRFKEAMAELDYFERSAQKNA